MEPQTRDQLPFPSQLEVDGALMVAVVAIVAVQLALALVLFGTASLDRRIGEARARSVLVVPSRGVRAPVPVLDRRLPRPG